jgi:hypothetical protein
LLTRDDLMISFCSGQILVFVSFIIACIAAAQMQGTGSSSSSLSFCAMWTALLLIIISILGSAIMRKVRYAIVSCVSSRTC